MNLFRKIFKQRPYAYADIFIHPELNTAAFLDNGMIKPEIDPVLAGTCKNESNCTVFFRDGTWLTTWGQGSNEHSQDEKIVFAVSSDRGRTWSPPRTIIGSNPERKERNSYGIPFLVPQTERLYLFFFTVSRLEWPIKESGLLFFIYSDDRGATWSQKYLVELAERNIQSFPGRVHGWVNHPPKIMPDGKVVFSFSSERVRHPDYIRNWDWRLNTAETNVVECVNLLTEADPLNLEFRTYPEGGYGIRVDVHANWDNPSLNTMAELFGGRKEEFGFNLQELTLAALPSGRWIGTGRSYLGTVAYTESFDHGVTWSLAQPLRYSPDGDPIAHPMTMCPITELSDGRVVLMFTNNDGTRRGARHVWDGNGITRNPQWMVVGREVPGQRENGGLVFGTPEIISEVDDCGETNLKTGICMPQFFERDGRYFVAYSANKEYILLDEIPGAVLDRMTPP